MVEGELEVIRKAFLEVAENFGEAKEKIKWREYPGKGKVIEACNAYILPEVCLKIYRMVPIDKEMHEVDIAKELIEYHKKTGTTTMDYYEHKEKQYYKTLIEYIDENDVLGVIYEGTTFKIEFKTYEVLETVDDCWLAYIINDWESLEDVMEACILAIRKNNKIVLEIMFWYPILGMIKARIIPMGSPLNTGEMKLIINEVLKPMKEILLEQIKYEKMPPEEKEFNDYENQDI